MDEKSYLLYTLPSTGISNSKLNTDRIEKKNVSAGHILKFKGSAGRIEETKLC